MAHKIGENVTLYEPDIISSEVKLNFYQEDDSVVDRTKKGCVSEDTTTTTTTNPIMVSGPSVTLGSTSSSSPTTIPLVSPPSGSCLEDSRYRCGVEVTSCNNGSGGRCLGEGHKGEEEVWRRDSDGEGVSRNPNTTGMVGGGSSASSFEAQQQQQQQQQQIDFDHQQSAPQACAVMEHVDHHHNQHHHHHLNPYSSDEWDESDLSDTDGDHSDSSDDDDPKSQVDRLIDQVTLVYLDGENSNLSSETESSDESDYDDSDSDSDITDVSPLISATASPLGLSPVLPRRALGTSPLALHDNRDLSTFDYPSVNGSGYPPHTHPVHPSHGSSGDNSTDMSGLLKAVVELEKKKQQRRKQGGHRTRSESSYHHHHHHHHNNTHNNHHQHYNDRLTTTTTTESSSRDDNRLNGTTTTTNNHHHHRSSPISIHPIDASPHHRHLRRPSNNHHQRRKNMSFTNEEVRRIDRDNQILLQKIVSAHSKSNNRSQAHHHHHHHHHASNNRSVHRPANATVSRRREDERIRRDNMILLRKIQEAKPSREVASFRSPRHRASPGLRPPSSLPPPTPGSCGALARSGHAATPTPRKETALCKDDGRSTLVKCKECNEAYPTLNNYREHLLVQHHIEAHKTHHEFTSEKEFLAWKGSIEMDVGVNYTSHGGSWKSSEGKKQIFYCRRSGEKSTKTQDTSEKKRTKKSPGTCKLGLYCTSSMEVVKADGRIRVTFYYDHHDHELGLPDLVHMVLPKSEKYRIAASKSSSCSQSMITTEEIEMKQDIVCKEDSTRSQVEEQITEVKMKLQSLLSECDEMKDLESVKALNNYLSKAYGIVHAGRTYTAQSNNLPVDTSTVLEPSNKNVVKQDRLHSTKKRKRKDEGKSLKKSSVRARQKIVESLAKSQSDISFPIMSTGAICDEHSYC
ncbi:hypothetical protein Pmani_026254 [Petrolisthes manimaculis]|uniref:C2H2-type domain-containing protein n=1 Tax=Petrolisthes manimaculis TaxID=1843537 RepID=A0AAE1P3Y7_9EUCA|nr:hypothetical protein Pmani_026254 [Petrolisthes manimaculis]